MSRLVSFVARWSLPAAAVTLAACAAKLPPRLSPRPSPVPVGAVASETQKATRAALETLRQGGNAVDAAITAALVGGVVAPQSSGIGGGGFALVWDAKRATTTFFDFRESAPAGLDPAAFDSPEGPTAGVRVGVPGEVAGLWELHKKWGRRTFAEDAQPAVKFARQGFLPEAHLLWVLETVLPKLTVRVPRRFTDFVAQNPKQPIQNPELAATLESIGARGPSAFYEGPVARCLVEAVRAQGGSLSEQDLRDYQVRERTPLRTKWEGLELLTMPPPSGGGVTLLETLGSYTKAELAALDLTTAEGIHSLAETFRGALTDRLRGVADPSVQPFEERRWLDPVRMRARRSTYRPDVTRTTGVFAAEEHGTSHLVVVDQEQNVVSLTTTVNTSFGAKFYADPCGVLLNDELSDFVPRPKAAQAGVPNPPGAARPGARPPSSMTPTLVLSEGRPILALGGSGGPRIATGVTQVALRALGQNLPLAEAIARPRVHMGFDGELFLEPGLASPAVIEDLRRRGERVREDSSFRGLNAIQAVALGGPNRPGTPPGPVPVADPRKFGWAEVQ